MDHHFDFHSVSKITKSLCLLEKVKNKSRILTGWSSRSAIPFPILFFPLALFALERSRPPGCALPVIKWPRVRNAVRNVDASARYTRYRVIYRANNKFRLATSALSNDAYVVSSRIFLLFLSGVKVLLHFVLVYKCPTLCRIFVEKYVI